MSQTGELLDRIKEVLGNNPRGMSITEIAAAIDLNRNSVAKYVNMLLVSGQVEMRTHAAAKVFYLTQRIPLSNLLGISNDGVLVVDQALRVAQVNDNFCYLTGIEREEIEDRYILEIADLPLNAGRMLTHLKSALNGKKIREEDSLMKEGVCRHLRVHYVPTTFDDGESAVAVMLTDITDQKNLARRLEETEERYRILAESAQDIIFLASHEGRILYMNAYGAEILKSDPDSLRGRSITEIFPCDEDKDCIDEVLQAIRISEPVSHEARHILAGTDYWFEHRLIPIDGDGNAAPYIMGLSRDITLRKRNEIELERHREHLEHLVAERTAELQQSEERLRMALEGANEGLWDREIDTGRVYFSPRYYTLLGYEPGEFPPDYDVWKSLVHPDDLAAALEEMEKHKAGEKPYYRKIFRMRSKSGEYRWILSRGRVVERSPEGKPLRVVGTHTDITEQKQAEEALRQSETQLSRIFLNNMVAMAIWAKSGEIVNANDAFLDLLGYTRAELEAGQIRWNEITPSDYSERDLEAVAEVEAKGFCSPYEKCFRHKGGHLIPIIIGGGDFDESRGTGILFVVDLTERKQAEEALRESEMTLAAELDTARHLQHVSTQMIEAENIQTLYDQILDTAVAITHADFASIQMLYPERGTAGELRLLGHRGFAEEAARIWEWVHPDSESACGIAFRTRQRVMIPDIRQCEFMTDSPDLKAYRETGIRAVQTTPLVSRSGTLLGMLSTHWRQPHEPTETELRSFDLLARQAADLIYRNQSEKTLRESEERLVLAKDASRLGIYDYNLRTGALQWDARVRELWGVGRDEPITYETFQAGIHPDDCEAVQQATDIALDPAGEGKYFTEYRVISRADGSTRWVASTGQAFFERGRAIRLVGTVQDITERKQAEEALARSEAEQRLILDSSVEQFAYFDTDLRVLWCNQAMADAIGQPEEGIRGEYCYRLRHQRSEPCEGCPVMKALATGEAQETEFEAPDGRIWFCRGQPILDETGNVVNLIEFCYDITKRKQTEETLLKSEEKFRTIAAFTYDWEYWLGPDGRYLYVSPSCERITGYRADEFLEDPGLMMRITHPDDRALVADHLERGVPDSNDCAIDFRIITRSGEVRWIGHSCRPVYNAAGQYIGVRGSNRDISKRKQMEDALREAGAYTRSLIEASLDPLVTISPDGRITDVNAATEAVTGYSRDVLIGTDFSDYFTDPAMARAGYQQVFRDGQVRNYPLEIRHRDGTITPVIYTATVYRDEDGNVAGVFAAARDISEQKRADNEKTILTRIIDAAPCSITVKDLEGRFLYANQRTYDLHGYSPEEFFAISLHELSVPESAELIELRTQQICETGEAVFEVAHRHKDGTAFPLRVHAQTVTWDDKPAILSLAEDITEEKKAEAALQESEERLRRAVKSAREFLFRIEFTPEPAFTYIDPEVATITGISAEEFAADPSIAFRLIHPEDRAAFDKMRRGETNPSRPLTLRWTRTDGQMVWIEHYHTPFYDAEGNLRAVEAIVRDVTLQKQAEEALRQRTEELERLNQQLEESREQYRYLIEHAPDMIALHDGDRYHYINPAGLRLLRAQNPDEIVGKSVMTFLHPDFRKMVKTRSDQIESMASDVPRVEEKLIALDGSIVDVEVTAHPMESQGKRLIQVIARDITDRKKAEEALRESEERFRYIAEHSPDILYTLDREGRITYVSPSIERITGHTPTELIGKNYMDYILESDIPKAYRARKRALEGEELLQLQLNLVGKNGETVPLECIASPAYKNAIVIGTLGLARKITPGE
ncbi:PAS domain S-box protein [Methanoculleus sp. FWC-SCC1]|uniref:histidine kinase n=1 Tax=Methanoculleus frigidifontis TaxID=2584085 RepID=A0ABT8M7H7_9EURY|nr:PAS domain S-box protein [Methanoculleus sp. FWC-SCC1]MDN7023889.1 PAS domain S-box protein [Methanoculleus sp. FWC-SCC1]